MNGWFALFKIDIRSKPIKKIRFSLNSNSNLSWCILRVKVSGPTWTKCESGHFRLLYYEWWDICSPRRLLLKLSVITTIIIILFYLGRPLKKCLFIFKKTLVNFGCFFKRNSIITITSFNNYLFLKVTIL